MHRYDRVESELEPRLDGASSALGRGLGQALQSETGPSSTRLTAARTRVLKCPARSHGTGVTIRWGHGNAMRFSQNSGGEIERHFNSPQVRIWGVKLEVFEGLPDAERGIRNAVAPNRS